MVNMESTIKKVTVFCGSNTGKDEAFTKDCLELARALYKNHISLIYGGGNVGLMGVLADEILRLGGEVIGVIPKKLVEIEVAHTGLTKLHVVEGMHERKALMASLADAFLVLPGGIGTMEEFFEIYTWMQLGYHDKPIAISNVNGYYNVLKDLLNKLVEQSFVKTSQVEKLIIGDNSADILNRIIESSRLSAKPA
jgi:uncharacterized protein (TIGR00730 family)